jgi:hypothetical protein
MAVAFFIALLSLFSVAQSGHPSYDPATHQESLKPRDSFVDSTLKRINPSDADYGECLTESRTMLLEETVKNTYFWSNIVALGLLGCLFIIIVYQHTIQTKREWTAAEMLGQFEQSLARSNANVEEVTKRNRALTESLADLKHSVLHAPPLPSDTADRTPSRPTRSHTVSIPVSATAAPKGNGAKPIPDQASFVTAAPSPGGQIALFKPEVELVTKVNALEQQLGRSHEMEKVLRRQLNETGRKLQAEQERNRSLKGESGLVAKTNKELHENGER